VSGDSDGRDGAEAVGVQRMSEPTLSEQREYYDRLWSKLARRPVKHQHLKNRMYAIRRWVSALELPEGARILDFGCGLGDISNLLSSFGTVDGIDLSPAATEIAAQRFPHINFSHGDLFEEPIEDRSYHLVVSSEVFEHVATERRNDFLNRIERLLAPGGYLLLTTPNDILSSQVHDLDQPLENHFTPDDLRNAVERRLDVVKLASTHAFAPLRCHRSRFWQLLRMVVYAIPFGRWFWERPSRAGLEGMYLVVLARSR
jgi:cyclopropane fatty-acyl-phospholipid synthase-like methyltransferase